MTRARHIRYARHCWSSRHARALRYDIDGIRDEWLSDDAWLEIADDIRRMHRRWREDARRSQAAHAARLSAPRTAHMERAAA